MRSIYIFAGRLLRLLVSFTLAQLFSEQVLAQSQQYQRPAKNVVNEQPAADAKTDKDDLKVDLSDIEKKYWSPKDTDFSVVQSRTYTKEKRFSMSMQYGPVMNDIYNKGYNLGMTLNYFLSERHGFGIHLVTANWENTKAIDALRYEVGAGKAGAEPDRGRMKNFYGVSYSWVPIYAKMSLLGEKILYFDMAITPLVGITHYDKLSIIGDIPESSFTWGFDITQYYFLSRNWAIRADFKNTWYKEERVTYKTGDPISSQQKNTTILLFGVTLYF